MKIESLVSVIVNVHNGSELIRQAIDSIYQQTYSNFEIVVYDNASTDVEALQEALSGYDHRLVSYRSERFMELGEARNEAIKKSQGEFISFLDSDDVMLPQKLEKELLRFKGEVALVYSNSIFFWEDDGRESILYKTPPPEGNIFRDLLTNYCISLETVMFRRTALDEDERWWFPKDYSMCEEAELFTRLAYKYPFAYVDEPLAKYRIHQKNWSHTRLELFVKDSEDMLKRFAEYIPDFYEEYAPEITIFEGNILFQKAADEWERGRRVQASLCLL